MILDLYFLDCGLRMSFRNLILEAYVYTKLVTSSGNLPPRRLYFGGSRLYTNSQKYVPFVHRCGM
jgi:hypothetical protein